MSDAERAARAEARRKTMWIRKTTLGDDADGDVLRGPEAVSLVWSLTLQSWALAGKPVPSYPRSEIPVRFVPGSR